MTTRNIASIIQSVSCVKETASPQRNNNNIQVASLNNRDKTKHSTQKPTALSLSKYLTSEECIRVNNHSQLAQLIKDCKNDSIQVYESPKTDKAAKKIARAIHSENEKQQFIRAQAITDDNGTVLLGVKSRSLTPETTLGLLSSEIIYKKDLQLGKHLGTEKKGNIRYLEKETDAAILLYPAPKKQTEAKKIATKLHKQNENENYIRSQVILDDKDSLVGVRVTSSSLEVKSELTPTSAAKPERALTPKIKPEQAPTPAAKPKQVLAPKIRPEQAPTPADKPKQVSTPEIELGKLTSNEIIFYNQLPLDKYVQVEAPSKNIYQGKGTEKGKSFLLYSSPKTGEEVAKFVRTVKRKNQKEGYTYSQIILDDNGKSVVGITANSRMPTPETVNESKKTVSKPKKASSKKTVRFENDVLIRFTHKPNKDLKSDLLTKESDLLTEEEKEIREFLIPLNDLDGAQKSVKRADAKHAYTPTDKDKAMNEIAFVIENGGNSWIETNFKSREEWYKSEPNINLKEYAHYLNNPEEFKKEYERIQQEQ